MLNESIFHSEAGMADGERLQLRIGGNRTQGVEVFTLHDIWAKNFQQHQITSPLRKDFKK